MISYYLPSGSKIGVGYQVHELASELTRRGNHVVVFSACPPVAGANYAHRQIHLEGPMRTFRFATALRRVDFSDFDVLHAHGDDYWLWRRRVRVHVRTIHGSCFEEALRIRGFKERARMIALGLSEILASLVADRTVLVSPQTRRWLPWARDIIPNGIDADRFYPVARDRPRRPVILFVGTWHGRKRGKELADVFSMEVRPKIPDAELWMVTRDAPADTPCGVKVLGAIDDAALTSAYRAASLFCLPSAYEGFGIPYAEAMSSGLPVVATPNPGARYVTDDGRAGVLVELHELGAMLVALLECEERQVAIAKAGLERSRTFALAGVVDDYEAMYRSRQMSERSGLEPK